MAPEAIRVSSHDVVIWALPPDSRRVKVQIPQGFHLQSHDSIQ